MQKHNNRNQKRQQHLDAVTTLTNTEELERELSFSGIITEVSIFLAGICFASILLLYQFRDKIDLTTLQYLAWSLALSTVFFTFCALCCSLKSEKGASLFFFINFLAGFVSFFISLFLLLSLIDTTIAIVTVGVATILFFVYLGISNAQR